MPRGKSFKIGYVRVRSRGLGNWLADFRYPWSGRRRRVTLRATSESDAQRQAKALNDQVAAGRFNTGSKKACGPSVVKALQAAIEASGGNREALALRERDVNFEAATIKITETERHQPKNRFSFRTLPVGRRVLVICFTALARLF